VTSQKSYKTYVLRASIKTQVQRMPLVIDFTWSSWRFVIGPRKLKFLDRASR